MRPESRQTRGESAERYGDGEKAFFAFEGLQGLYTAYMRPRAGGVCAVWHAPSAGQVAGTEQRPRKSRTPTAPARAKAKAAAAKNPPLDVRSTAGYRLRCGARHPIRSVRRTKRRNRARSEREKPQGAAH